MQDTKNKKSKTPTKIVKFLTEIKVLNRNNGMPRKLEWTVLFLIAITLFVSHSYNDIIITTRHGINLWYCLFDGKILNFFSYNAGIISGNDFFMIPQNAIYNFFIYVIFAIWNFPLWILENFAHVDVMNNFYCLIWSKTMIIFFLAISAQVLKKICIELKMNSNLVNWIVFYYLSSAFVFSSLLIMSQYDIISVTLMLIGLLMYLKGNMKSFVLWFMFAITLKYFALFVFVPLILLKEKRINRIIMYFFSGISLTLLTNFIFSFDKSSSVSTVFLLEMLQKFTNQVLEISIGNTSWFYLLIILLFIYCFYKEIKTKEDLDKFSVYVSFMSFAVFFGFTNSHPYWIIFILPFTLLLIFQNAKNLRINMVIETIMSCALILAQMIVYPFCFSDYTYKAMLLPRIFIKLSDLPKLLTTDSLAKHPFFNLFVMENILPILIALFVACLIALAVINFPSTKKDKVIDQEIDANLILVRLLLGGVVCLLPIAGYFVSVFYKLYFF